MKTKKYIKTIIVIISVITIINIGIELICQNTVLATSTSSYRRDQQEGEFLIGFIILCMLGGPILGIILINKYVISRKKEIINQDIETENLIKNWVKGFNKHELINQGYNTFCSVKNAFMNFKLEDIKNSISDELYKKYVLQLNELKEKGEQEIYNNFQMINCKLLNAYKNNNTVIVEIAYKIQFDSYRINQSTGQKAMEYLNNDWILGPNMILKFSNILNENGETVNNKWILESEKDLGGLEIENYKYNKELVK